MQSQILDRKIEDRKIWIRIFLYSIFLSTLAFAAPRPNNVLILADDLGGCDVGCHGSTFYRTPHIAVLAKRGMLFRNAYSASPHRWG